MKQIIDGNEVRILLVSGENLAGIPIFAYVAIRGDHIKKFLEAQHSGEFYPEDYGLILVSGEGDPSEEVQDKMESEYGFKRNSLVSISDRSKELEIIKDIQSPVSKWNPFAGFIGNSLQNDNSDKLNLFSILFWQQNLSARLEIIKESQVRLKSNSSLRDISDLYKSSLEKDMSGFLLWYKKFASFDLGGFKPTFDFTYRITDSLNSDAFTEINVSAQCTEITITKGLIFSINDLMHRVSCNEGILSYCLDRKKTIWEGTLCYWPESKNIPKVRFSDYLSKKNKSFGLYTSSFIDNPLGLFHCGIPLGDEDRLYLASLMEFISLTWILFHEEAHYWHGHLHYLQEDRIKICESDDTTNDFDETLLKTFEWQADRNAIGDIINIFFIATGQPAFELPHHFKTENDLSWYIRIIVCAIGSTIMIFQKMKLINQKDSYYPSPECRLTTVLAIIYSRLMNSIAQHERLFNSYDPTTISETILASLHAALDDLIGIEDIFANSVDFENDVQRVVFEEINPQSLLFIDELENISKIVKGVANNLTSDDYDVEKKWFKEYKELAKKHNDVFENLLPKYRNATSSCGSPYK